MNRKPKTFSSFAPAVVPAGSPCAGDGGGGEVKTGIPKTLNPQMTQIYTDKDKRDACLQSADICG
jgi:hypothetical protein